MTGRPETPISVRFWQKVDQSTSCWNWTGAQDGGGYGVLKRKDGAQLKAHRVSYEMHNGHIPAGTFVMHSCDNRRCVNPGHLKLGTHDENMADMVSKGRSPKVIGEKNGASKLTADLARRVRGDVRSQIVIARDFGISQGAVSKIKRGLVWGHA